MKITKELLEHLNVITISLNNKNNDILCFLDRIEKNVWTFLISEKQTFEQNDLAFKIVFNQENKPCKFKAEISEFGENWITVIPYKSNNSRFIIFQKVLSDMEEKYELYGRRKEERIKIGKAQFKTFGLASIQQQVFVHGIKFIQPCVVLDASLHGICIITTSTPLIQNEETFFIKLMFEQPIYTVILKAHKVYSRLNKTDSKTFITLSCQLLEPIHFEWKNRIIKMLS